MTAGMRRISTMVLAAVLIAGGLFNIHTLAVGPGVSFSYLQSGFTQELIGVTDNLLTGDVDGDEVPDGILGGVAFDPHGNPMVAECEFVNTRLHVFDLQSSSVPLVHGNDLSSEVVLNSQGGCGLVNHPDGYLYVAMNNGQNGIAKVTRATGQWVAFMGPPGNSLGIAVDPQVNGSGTHDIVYAAADCRFTENGCTYIRLDPADGSYSTFADLDAEDADFTDGMYFDPTGQFLFIANRSPEMRLTVLNRAGHVVQHVPMPTHLDSNSDEVQSEPDGIAFHATTPKFVVTNNTDGTMTRFNFPNDDYTQAPPALDGIQLFASGGYRGDLSQVGEDGCIYLTQKGVNYNDLVPFAYNDPTNSVVRICSEPNGPGGFSPAPGVEKEEGNTGTITGTIFQDNNHNGVQDAGEPGIPGVTVTITDQNGNPVVPPGPNTDTTDASGIFDFPDLPPGTFTITVTPPEGLSSENPPTTIVTVDSSSTTPVTTNFPFVAGSIAGFAYVDLNGDGFKNAGEPGIPNVSIGLAGGPGGSATTGADGGYSFGDLPGASYNVSAPASAAGKTRSTTSPLSVVLSAGQNATDVNFGYVPGGLSGFAYVDLNGNDVKDGGEPGIDGVTISLSGDFSATATTSGGGAYSFAGLDAGGFTVSAPSTADGKSLSTASSLSVTLAEGQHSPDHNFGYVPGEISGFAYVDANRNGQKDGGEPGLPGAVITLSGGPGGTATTAGDGSYSFTGLDAGSFTLDAPATVSSKQLSTASPLSVSLGAGQHSPDHNFGYVPGAISGFAYVDTNGNDTMDAGEPGIPGVSIALSGHASDSTTTGADGSYSFASLDGGSYSVTAPAVAAAKALSTTSPLPVPLAAGEDRTHVDFGYAPGGVAGFAYVDVNNNGVKDAGEPGIPGVTVTLSGSPTVTTTTGSDGSYSFSAIEAGTHSVAAPNTAAGKNLTTGSPLTVPLAAGEHKTDVNFGYVPGTISGFAYVDSNRNNIKDSGEPGIPNVTITLTTTGATQMTSATGAYSFSSLDGGTYTITAPGVAANKGLSTTNPLTPTLAAGGSVPNQNFGYVPGSISGFAYVDSDGDGQKDAGEAGIGGVTITLAPGVTQVTVSNGSYTFSSLDSANYSVSAPSTASGKVRSTPSPLPVNLAPAEVRTNVNFGYVTPGSICGYTYIDLNHNGQKDCGEPGISGVTVTLSGSASGTTVTGANGNYSFTGLPSGSYLVSAPPTAAGHTLWTASPLAVSLAQGQSKTNVNFGYLRLPYTTYTQGGWGSTPNGNNPGMILKNNFASVYPSGITIGGGYTLKFTSQVAVQNFLPAGGTAAKLTSSKTNPTSSSAGVFAGQVLALKINVDFSNAGKIAPGLAALKVAPGNELAGYTVAQVLSLANTVLGGNSSALPSGVTLSELNSLVGLINQNFDNGTADSQDLIP